MSPVVPELAARLFDLVGVEVEVSPKLHNAAVLSLDNSVVFAAADLTPAGWVDVADRVLSATVDRLGPMEAGR